MKTVKLKNGAELTDNSMGRLDEIFAFADKNGMRAHLDEKLEYLTCWQYSNLPFYDGKKLETIVYGDFAPLSLTFGRYINGKLNGNGGFIFHGRHDNGGDGGFPTFSVSLENNTNPHWSIHT